MNITITLRKLKTMGRGVKGPAISGPTHIPEREVQEVAVAEEGLTGGPLVEVVNHPHIGSHELQQRLPHNRGRLRHWSLVCPEVLSAVGSEKTLSVPGWSSALLHLYLLPALP